MEQKSFEGTWEEILLHASELTGQRVRLTILADTTSNHANTEKLDKLLQGKVGRVSFSPANLSEQTEAAFTEILENKYKTLQD